MTGDSPDPVVRRIMEDFAERTGLTSDRPKRRYLWTDAFAVCNYLGLHARSGEPGDLDMALRLVEQVHRVLGRHREDDSRSGWISGLEEAEGERHPTIGGLRIGKPLNERAPTDPFDRRLEWERDGQYYHYLTRWMLALERVAAAAGDPLYHDRAVELARTAHARFAHSAGAPGGAPGPGDRPAPWNAEPSAHPPTRLYWKMSIDLSRPLVPGAGQHDPLDGLAVFVTLAGTGARSERADSPTLEREIRELKRMCEGSRWVTDDPLGIGGILTSAYLLTREYAGGRTEKDRAESIVSGHMLQRLLGDALHSVEAYTAGRGFTGPAAGRLPFRELGLCIGLRAIESLGTMLHETPERILPGDRIADGVEALLPHTAIADRIEQFWSDPRNRTARSWSEHRDINSVMLATGVAPEGYLAS